MSADPEALPPDLEELQAFRKAARAVVRDEGLTVTAKCVGLIRLAQRAREEAAMPEWVQEAIWREAGPFVMDEPEGSLEQDPWMRKHRALLAQGYVRCANCGCLLPDEKTLDRQERLRLAAIAEARAHEGAVG